VSRDFTSGAVDWGDISALHYSGSTLTVCAWIRPDSVSGVRGIFGSNDWSAFSGLKGFRLATNGTALRFSKLGVIDIASSGITCTTGAWQFVSIAAVAGSNTFYRITPAGSVTTSTNIDGQGISVGTTQHVIVGARSSGTSGGYTDRFDGRIAEVSCWIDTKLSADEVLAVAFGGPFGCGVLPTFYAPLWGAGTGEPDLSGSGVAGTIDGTAAQADHAPAGCPFPVAA
jgi:hypothetical protein